MKLLLVEDHARIAAAIQQGLERSGYVVDVAHDGQTGLDLALGESYDLLILDWMLPELSGLEICTQLRKTKTTPILFLTARTGSDSVVTGLDAGADDYLEKPFAFEELLARIKALLRRPAALVPTVVSYKDLAFDEAGKRVTRAGVEVHLSPKELALLRFLLANPGQVFSAQDLVEKVWPFDSEVLPNNAQVYISYLRHKLDKQFPDKPALLHSKRGFGYTLE